MNHSRKHTHTHTRSLISFYLLLVVYSKNIRIIKIYYRTSKYLSTASRCVALGADILHTTKHILFLCARAWSSTFSPSSANTNLWLCISEFLSFRHHITSYIITTYMQIGQNIPNRMYGPIFPGQSCIECFVTRSIFIMTFDNSTNNIACKSCSLLKLLSLWFVNTKIRHSCDSKTRRLSATDSTVYSWRWRR